MLHPIPLFFFRICIRVCRQYAFSLWITHPGFRDIQFLSTIEPSFLVKFRRTSVPQGICPCLNWVLVEHYFHAFRFQRAFKQFLNRLNSWFVAPICPHIVELVFAYRTAYLPAAMIISLASLTYGESFCIHHHTSSLDKLAKF